MSGFSFGFEAEMLNAGFQILLAFEAMNGEF
jgi:hypothetical protein